MAYTYLPAILRGDGLFHDGDASMATPHVSEKRGGVSPD